MPTATTRRGVATFCEAGPTGDPRATGGPTPVRRRDDDRIVPIAAAAMRATAPLRRGGLKIDPGFAHGMLAIDADARDADLPGCIGA